MSVFDPQQQLLSNARLDYRGLLDAVKSHSLRAFCAGFKHPLLVGSAVISGDLNEAAVPGGTALFHYQDIHGEAANRRILERAIFLLWRQPGSESPPGSFVIGRGKNCDIVLPDHPVSRQHARIRVSRGNYFITDLGATNTTSINALPLEPHQETPLAVGDELAFSRYCFQFLEAEQLYQLLLDRMQLAGDSE